MTTIESVTDARFQEDVLAAPGTTVVEFWAEWCGPCRALSPILQRLQEEHADRIRIVKINADENMRPVFNGKSQVSRFEMTKLVSGHLR